MMSKRQASRLFAKTKLQTEFLSKRMDVLTPGDFVCKLVLNIQNRLNDIIGGKIKKEEDKIRQMNILQSEMKVVNIELKKVMDNEKASN